jgi:hypothetical protein
MMFNLKKILNELSPKQIRVRKFRMVNEDSNEFELEFTEDQFDKLNSIIKNMGGDLTPFIEENLNEAPTQFDFQKSELTDLEKYIQDKLNSSAKNKKKDELVSAIVSKYGDDDIKFIHNEIEQKRKGKLSKEQKKEYSDFITHYAEELEKKLKKEKSKIKVAIDTSILEKTKEYVTQGSEALNWYHDVHDSIMEQFGESNGTLFLILLAILSPRNKLGDNLEFAAKIYAAIQEDINDPVSIKALQELFSSENPSDITKIVSNPKREVRKQYANKYGNDTVKQAVEKWDRGEALNKKEKTEYDTFFQEYGKQIYDTTLDVMKNINPRVVDTRLFKVLAHNKMGMVSTYGKNLMQVLNQYIKNGFKFSKTQIIQQLESHWSETGVLDKTTTPISAEKVFSFTLNLLDPRYSTLKKWNPVTIDTWMLNFFYPELVKTEREKLLNVPGVYVYLSRQIENMANQIKTSDGKKINALQLQAIIWVSIIKETKKNDPNYATKFEDAIAKKIEEMGIIEDNIKQIDDFFKLATEKINTTRMDIKSSIEKIGSKKMKYMD